MAELNFNALAPTGPRGFYQGFEQGQKEKVASEINQIKLDELKRDRDEMMQLRSQLKSLGQDPDPIKFLDALAQTGNPDYVKMAIEGKQKIKDLESYAKLGVIEPVTAMPAMPTGAPAPAPASVMRMPQAPAPTNALGSGTFGMGQPTANAMMPAPSAAPVTPAAPANALAPQPGADQVARAQQRIDQLLMFARSNPRMAGQAMAEAKILQDQLELFSKRGPAESAEVQTMRALGIPLTPAGYQQYRDAQRQERMLTPAEEQQKIRIAAAGRAPAQPAPPTITQIQDPSNPLQMITIDARRYTGGGVGSPGVIGTTGKSAPAAAAAQKQEQGATQAQDILDNLKYAYEELDRQRAIPSTQRGAVSNILTSIGTSGVGQVAGRVAGTEAQTQRDIIASARNQLFAAVKNATGLSAQNLNSNVEFTTWLNSLTDPSKSIEANREILANMEKFIGSGGKYSARQSGGRVTPAAGAKPSIAPPAGFTPDTPN